ncbi:unnamed protein product [Peniophora sp. CBMAI 1063]|nr:unnamed protein product [Peniophora sp. CBMAI 1063]
MHYNNKTTHLQHVRARVTAGLKRRWRARRLANRIREPHNESTKRGHCPVKPSEASATRRRRGEGRGQSWAKENKRKSQSRAIRASGVFGKCRLARQFRPFPIRRVSAFATCVFRPPPITAPLPRSRSAPPCLVRYPRVYELLGAFAFLRGSSYSTSLRRAPADAPPTGRVARQARKAIFVAQGSRLCLLPSTYARGLQPPGDVVNARLCFDTCVGRAYARNP